MVQDKMVVVMLPLSLLRHNEEAVVAARFLELGLTAYGRDESEATLEVKKLFNRFIHSHRKRGQLEERLNRAGVKWYWADEYTGDTPIENTNELFKTWATIFERPPASVPCPVAA